MSLAIGHWDAACGTSAAREHVIRAQPTLTFEYQAGNGFHRLPFSSRGYLPGSPLLSSYGSAPRTRPPALLSTRHVARQVTCSASSTRRAHCSLTRTTLLFSSLPVRPTRWPLLWQPQRPAHGCPPWPRYRVSAMRHSRRAPRPAAFLSRPQLRSGSWQVIDAAAAAPAVVEATMAAPIVPYGHRRPQ